MPSYFGHDMSSEQLALQVLADDLALIFVRAKSTIEREAILAQVKESGMPREVWEDTLARARRYVEGSLRQPADRPIKHPCTPDARSSS